MTMLLETPTTSADLEVLSTDQVKEELARNLAITKDSLVRAARCVQVLDQRGEDLSDVPPMLLSMLRKVAGGLILPELAFKLMDKPLLLAKVSECPLAQQSALDRDAGIVVYERHANGEWDATRKPVTNLSFPEMHQVFGPTGLRDEAEQKAYLNSRKEKIEEPSLPRVPFRIIPARKVVKVFDPCEITLSQLKGWVKQLA